MNPTEIPKDQTLVDLTPPLTSTNLSQPNPSKRKGLMPLLGIITIVFLLFLTCTMAAIAYEVLPVKLGALDEPIRQFVMNIPFTPKTPRFLLEKAALAQGKVSKNTIDISVSGKSNTTTAILGLNQLDAQVKGGVDYADPKNVRLNLNASITKDFNVDIRKDDATVYFKVNKVPAMLLAFMHIDADKLQPILENWIAWDTSHLPTEASKRLENASSSKSTTNEFIKKALDNFLDPKILKAMQVSSDTVDNFKTHKLTLKATPEILDIIQQKVEEQQAKPKSSYSTPTKLSDSLKNTTIEIWIDQQNYYVRKMIVQTDIKSLTTPVLPNVLGIQDDVLAATTTDSQGTDATFVLVMKLGDFGQPVDVQVPAKAIPPDQFYKQVVAVAQSATGSADYSGSADIVIAKAHNSRRLSDLQIVRHAVDLMLAESSVSQKPFKPNANGSSCTGTDSSSGTGWVPYNSAVSDLKKYLTALPKDPTNAAPYCYTFKAAANGIDYEINAVLEDGGTAKSTMLQDGGNNINRYETGTDLKVLP